MTYGWPLPFYPPKCGRLRVCKNFLHVCSIGSCAHVFGAFSAIGTTGNFRLWHKTYMPMLPRQRSRSLLAVIAVMVLLRNPYRLRVKVISRNKTYLKGHLQIAVGDHFHKCMAERQEA
jgi:hypothetical protein